MFELLAHAVHHRNGVRIAALLQHGQIDRSLPVHAHGVVLQRVGVLGDADIGHPHRILAGELDRHIG
jgi:hypothetical protein